MQQTLEDIVKNGKAYKTKLQKILADRGMSQRDLIRLIEKETGEEYSPDRICRYVNGKTDNMLVSSIKVMAKALGVPPGDLIG